MVDEETGDVLNTAAALITIGELLIRVGTLLVKGTKKKPSTTKRGKPSKQKRRK